MVVISIIVIKHNIFKTTFCRLVLLFCRLILILKYSDLYQIQKSNYLNINLFT